MNLNHKMEPKIIQPFESYTFEKLCEHIFHIRQAFDWPGTPVHDANEPEHMRFNRWCWHDLPWLRTLHHDPEFISQISKIVGRPLKPSYVFLSMYNQDGVCPLHTDRPTCQFTVDLCLRQDDTWPIYVDDKPYVLKPGEALVYSGTGQPHYRKPMKESSKATYCDLAFFHFVPTSWMGNLK